MTDSLGLKLQRITIILSLGLVLWGLVSPSGWRTGLQNNRWSLAVRDTLAKPAAKAYPIDPVPTHHPHARLLLGRLAFEQGELDRALNWISSQDLASQPIAMGMVAQICYRQGDYLGALAIWKDLEHSAALSKAAHDLRNQGQLSLALLAAQYAYSFNPEATSLQLAMLLKDQGQVLETKTILDTALKNYPDSNYAQDWLLALGDIYQNEQDLAQAESCFQQAIKQDPADPTPWVRLGWLFYEYGGNSERALSHFKQAIQAAPEAGEGYYAVGQVLVREDRHSEAGEWFFQASKNGPEKLNHLLAYANWLRDMSQHEAALAEYQKAIELRPEYWYPYYDLSWAYQIKDQPEQAIRYIEKAIELDPNNLWVYLRAGAIFEAAGHADKALEAYRQAVAIKPDHAKALGAIERLENTGE